MSRSLIIEGFAGDLASLFSRKLRTMVERSSQTLKDQIPLRSRKILKKSLMDILWMSVVALIFSAIYFGSYIALMESNLLENGEWLRANRQLIVGLWVFIIAIMILWSPIYEYMYLRHYFYDIDKENLIIRKGVVAKSEITLPFSKITDVYVDQDVVDVMLGLYDVHISTPTAESGRFAHIDGVNKVGAQQLKKLILSRINK